MTGGGVELQRVSIPYHSPASDDSYGGNHLYEWMFVRDAAEHLFPVGGDVDRQAVFRLSSEAEGASRIVEAAFARFGGYAGHARSLSSRLSKFGIRAAHDLLSRGCDTYEVAPLVDAGNRAVGYLVVPVHGIRSLGGLTWQTVPRGARAGEVWEEVRPVQARLVWMPRNRVVRMRLPGQYRPLRSELRALRQVGKSVPDFAIDNLASDSADRVPYDLDELKQIEQRAVASISRSTGWNGRDTFRESVTGYYTIRRFLRFEAFKAMLRSTVVDTINRILDVAGAVVGFKAVVTVHHLPKLEEIRASCKDLAAGRLDYSETLRQYSVYSRPSDVPTSEK